MVRRWRQQAPSSPDIGKRLTKVKLFAVIPRLYDPNMADAIDRNARPPLLLFPGLLCDARLWRDQVKALSAIVRCVVADCTQDDTLHGMVQRALSAMPGRFAVAGLSMGGYAAMALMRSAPERIAGLCLMDTSARPDTPEQAKRRRGLMSLAARGRFKGVTPRLLPLLLHPDRLDDAALCDEVMAMAGRVGRAAYLRQQAAIAARPDSRPDLPRVAVPTLAAVGAGDQLTPPDLAAEIASLVPGARLHVVEGAGHLLPMERPAAATRVMREWLDEITLTKRSPE